MVSVFMPQPYMYQYIQTDYKGWYQSSLCLSNLSTTLLRMWLKRFFKKVCTCRHIQQPLAFDQMHQNSQEWHCTLPLLWEAVKTKTKQKLKWCTYTQRLSLAWLSSITIQRIFYIIKAKSNFSTEYSLCMILWCYVIYYIYIKSHVSWFREFFYVSHTHLSQIRHARGSHLLWCLLLGIEISSLTYFVCLVLFSCSRLSGVLMAWDSSFCSASLKESSEWLQVVECHLYGCNAQRVIYHHAEVWNTATYTEVIPDKRLIRKYVLNYMNWSVSTFSPYYLYKANSGNLPSSYILAKF